MKKSIICMFLAVVMVLTLSASAFAMTEIRSIGWSIIEDPFEGCDCELCKQPSAIKPYTMQSIPGFYYIQELRLNGRDAGNYAFLQYGTDDSGKYLLAKLKSEDVSKDGSTAIKDDALAEPDSKGYILDEAFIETSRKGVIVAKAATKKAIIFEVEGLVQCGQSYFGGQQVRVVPCKACKFDVEFKSVMLGGNSAWQLTADYSNVDLGEMGFLWELTEKGFRLCNAGEMPDIGVVTEPFSKDDEIVNIMRTLRKKTPLQSNCRKPSGELYLNADYFGRLYVSHAAVDTKTYILQNYGAHEWVYHNLGVLCMYRKCANCGQICTDVFLCPIWWFGDGDKAVPGLTPKEYEKAGADAIIYDKDRLELEEMEFVKKG